MLFSLTGCDMEKGYVCTCYFSDGKEMRNGIEFFQRDMDYDISKAETSALYTCIYDRNTQAALVDTPTYAKCTKKRIERR